MAKRSLTGMDIRAIRLFNGKMSQTEFGRVISPRRPYRKLTIINAENSDLPPRGIVNAVKVALYERRLKLPPGMVIPPDLDDTKKRRR